MRGVAQVREVQGEVGVDSMVALVAQVVINQTGVEAVPVTVALFVLDRLYTHQHVAVMTDSR